MSKKLDGKIYVLGYIGWTLVSWPRVSRSLGKKMQGKSHQKLQHNGKSWTSNPVIYYDNLWNPIY